MLSCSVKIDIYTVKETKIVTHLILFGFQIWLGGGQEVLNKKQYPKKIPRNIWTVAN